MVPKWRQMSLWPDDWYNLNDGGAEALQNIGEVWAKMGYEALGEDDYARLEPFMEPFDGVYNDEEVTIMSRVGNNGIQKELCRMFSQSSPDGDIWVLEWYTPKTNIQRRYLCDVAILLYGAQFDNDETQSMIMLTHALSSLRSLKLVVVDGDTIRGVRASPVEEAHANEVSFEDAQ